MKKVKLFEQFVTEGKDIFPNEVVGNDQILFKKEWEKMNGGKLAAKYNMYYRGYEIDFGGHIFGSVAELERFMKDYILSNNLYNKYKYMPEKPIGESVVNEGKYDFMSGLSIQFNGVDYTISSVKDDFVNVKDSKNNEKTFRLSAIVTQNPGVDVKPRTPRPSAWNKGIKSDAYSPSEYQKILKGAIKDAGGSEYAHDMAQSMIYDPGIRARIEKDYPMLRNTNQMIQRLQWDLEMYESYDVESTVNEETAYTVDKNTYRDYDRLNITSFDSIQFKQDGKKWIVRVVTAHDNIDTAALRKLGFTNQSDTRYAGISTFTKNANWHDLELTKKQFDQLVKIVDAGWASHAKAFADFYRDREAD